MTTDLDRALIALRVSRDHGHGAVLNDADVRALLAEIDRLRERQSSADMCLDAVHEARRVLREHFGGNLAFLDDDLVRGVVKMKEEIDRLTRERDEARAERDALAKALAELVACKALKDAGLRSPEDEDAYFRRKPAAWAAARAALAQIEQERSEQAKDAEAR